MHYSKYWFTSRAKLLAALLSVAAAFFTVIVLESRALAAVGGSWTQFQGNAAHSGFIPASFNPADFRHLWQVNEPGVLYFHGDLSVAIDESRIYTTRQNTVTYAFDLIAFDLDSGAELWRRPIPTDTRGTPSVSPPSIDDGRVFVDRAGYSGLVCHDSCGPPPALLGFAADTGELLFERPHSSQGYAPARPTPFGDQVFVDGGYYGGLYAYQKITGQNQWFTELPQEFQWVPAADENYTYAYFGGRSPTARLYVINPQTGNIDFEIFHSDSKSSLQNLYQTVVLGDQNNALALKPLVHVWVTCQLRPCQPYDSLAEIWLIRRAWHGRWQRTNCHPGRLTMKRVG